MTRLHLGVLAGLAAHHGIELACGVGLPGEPLLGRRGAALAWAGVFAGDTWFTARRPRSSVLAWANGAYQALALQHYVDWPWRWRRGVPVITTAEGLPARVLRPYNAALLTVVGLSAADSLRRGSTLHAVGLATLPVQLASARHHQAWLRAQGASNGRSRMMRAS